MITPVGTDVKRGDIIGTVGSTGRSTGPHLDWRINWKNKRLDPLACRTLVACIAHTASILKIYIVVLSLAVFGTIPAVQSTNNTPDGSVYDFVYVTEWGATDVGVSVSRWRIAENQFFMTGEFNASGLVQLMADFSGHVNIKAIRDDESWQGQQLVIASNWGSKTSVAETTWLHDGRIAATNTDPAPNLEEVHPIDAAMLRGVTDPFSAMMTMLNALTLASHAAGFFKFTMDVGAQS